MALVWILGVLRFNDLEVRFDDLNGELSFLDQCSVGNAWHMDFKSNLKSNDWRRKEVSLFFSLKMS